MEGGQRRACHNTVKQVMLRCRFHLTQWSVGLIAELPTRRTGATHKMTDKSAPEKATENATADSRARRLKAATHSAHELLDNSIMSKKPFSNRERYGQFLQVQYSFHRDIAALYDDAALDELLPDLKGRRRVELIRRDLVDLGLAVPGDEVAPVFTPGAAVDLPTALGWLYVAEGSNLGAAILLKEAAKLGFSESSGARHLAGAPEGRGLHWRTFTAALDAVPLSAEDEKHVFASAEIAFRRIQGLVEEVMA